MGDNCYSKQFIYYGFHVMEMLSFVDEDRVAVTDIRAIKQPKISICAGQDQRVITLAGSIENGKRKASVWCVCLFVRLSVRPLFQR